MTDYMNAARLCNCERDKLQGFRPDVLTDANYWTDEPVGGE